MLSIKSTQMITEILFDILDFVLNAVGIRIKLQLEFFVMAFWAST